MARSKHNGKPHGEITETPDVSHVRNIDVTHEMSDVNIYALLKFVAVLTVATAITFVLMWLLFHYFERQRIEPPPGPMAMTEIERLPPEPRLQAAPGFEIEIEGQRESLELREPQAEYRVLRRHWEQILSDGVKDEAGRVVGLPIEEAMKKVVQENVIPVRPEGAAQSLYDIGDEIPTAQSSGRVTVKRK